MAGTGSTTAGLMKGGERTCLPTTEGSGSLTSGHHGRGDMPAPVNTRTDKTLVDLHTRISKSHFQKAAVITHAGDPPEPA